MAKNDIRSVDEYIAMQPESVRGILERVRGAIRKGLPGAEETISYDMPSYKLHGSAVLQFAGWKQHYSLYTASEPVIAAFANELESRRIDKGTIRFSFAEPVPVELIERIAKFRAS